VDEADGAALEFHTALAELGRVPGEAETAVRLLVADSLICAVAMASGEPTRIAIGTVAPTVGCAGVRGSRDDWPVSGRNGCAGQGGRHEPAGRAFDSAASRPDWAWQRRKAENFGVDRAIVETVAEAQPVGPVSDVYRTPTHAAGAAAPLS
jgi:hypothetical protein